MQPDNSVRSLERYLYAMEHFSAMKKDTLESFGGKWVHFETILLSEIN